MSNLDSIYEKPEAHHKPELHFFPQAPDFPLETKQFHRTTSFFDLNGVVWKRYNVLKNKKKEKKPLEAFSFRQCAYLRTSGTFLENWGARSEEISAVEMASELCVKSKKAKWQTTYEWTSRAVAERIAVKRFWRVQLLARYLGRSIHQTVQSFFGFSDCLLISLDSKFLRNRAPSWKASFSRILI